MNPQDLRAELASVLEDMRKEAEILRSKVGGRFSAALLDKHADQISSALTSHGGGGEAVAFVDRKGNQIGGLRWTEAGSHADLPDGALLFTTPQPRGDVLPKSWWVNRLKEQEALTDKALARVAELEARGEGMVLVKLNEFLQNHDHGDRCPFWRMDGTEQDCTCGLLNARILAANALAAAPGEGSGQECGWQDANPAAVGRSHSPSNVGTQPATRQPNTPPPASQLAESHMTFPQGTEPHCSSHEHCEFDCIDCMDALERQRRAASQSDSYDRELIVKMLKDYQSIVRGEREQASYMMRSVEKQIVLLETSDNAAASRIRTVNLNDKEN